MATQSTTTLRKRFESLVRKAEAEIASNPGRYKLRLMLLAAFGYLVIFGFLALLIVLLGGTLYAALLSSGLFILLVKSKIIFVIGIAIWVLFRSLFVGISAPTGLVLRRKEYPALWNEIDSLRNELKALPVHEVVMVPEMNAAVAQTPRLGIFGPHKNTLVLGLELLMTLTPAQARSVLAHEFGHLSGEHGSFGNWIYRKRLTWARIGQAFSENGGIAEMPMTKFMSWYVPRLAGYSFALARSQEYEADAVAARLTTREDAAAALMLVNVRDELTPAAFWKPLLQRAITDPEPEARTFTKLYEHLKTVPMNSTLADQKVGAALRNKTGIADTHPALRDRLKAIAAGPVSLAQGAMAAEAWLGAGLSQVLAHFDAEWLERNRDGWRQRHEGAQVAQRHLEALAEKPASDLTQIEAWQLASILEDIRPDIDPLPAYQAYKARFPDDPDADFAIGRILLIEREDPAGLAYLETAANHRSYGETAAGMIAAHHQSHDQPELAEHWTARAEAAYDRMNEARAERSDAFVTDTFVKARLDDAELARIAEAIRQTAVGKKIKQLWLAEKSVKHFPDLPVYVLAAKPKFFAWNKEEIGQRLAGELTQQIELPDAWIFVPAVNSNRALVKKIKAGGRAIPY